jgi:hypothetical protein
MMNAQGNFIGQLCHIEAAEKGGPRFNPAMSNEERRSSPNLMLMCYEHHRITDDDSTRFTAATLRQFKTNHEQAFAWPDRAIAEKLVDWTSLDEPTNTKNLDRLKRVLELDEDQTNASLLAEVNSYIARFRLVPLHIRRFVGTVAERIYRLDANSSAVEYHAYGMMILVSDLVGALHISNYAIRQRAEALSHYNIGSLDEMYVGSDDKPREAVGIRSLPSGFNLWSCIAEFCIKAPVPMAGFTDALDFGCLDD